ncbi:ribonuclease P protein component [candidate division WOR-3 bacterium]|nr:ribonuclease P protein component [candidate division WOR-3 bacterium]
MKFGFGKKWRIKEREAIKRVYNNGNFYRGEFINIHYLSEEERKFSIRMERGIKGGLKRNKVRRLLREIIRNANPSLKNGLYIITGRKEALMEDYNKIKEDFDRLCLKENLWLKR